VLRKTAALPLWELDGTCGERGTGPPRSLF
jgi:hypothetical protein